jgi:putative transposase
MSRTFTNLLTHFVFGTKDREPLIRTDMRDELHAYLGGLARELKGKAFGINGTNDHVHMLVNLPPNVSVSDAMRFIKANSSAWARDKWKRLFAWQLGYGAFSVSKSSVPQVLRYIANQESHHRRIAFREEFLDLLQKHEIPYDERYLWV